MDWLNLHTKTLDSPEVVGAEPTDRGTWLMLQRYCIGQENGGRIAGCRAWKDRKWQQLARVTLAEVNRETDLWQWEGNDLIVWGYPVEKENIVRVKREIARQNGTGGGRPTKPEPEPVIQPTPEPISEPILVFSEKAEVEGKDKGNGNQKEAEEARRLCELHPKRDLSQPALRAAAAAVRRHGFDLVAEGVRSYAAAVAAWTPAERLQFVKGAADFFGEDVWNQPAVNWRGRIGTNGHAPVRHREISVGGREPSLNLMKELYPETK